MTLEEFQSPEAVIRELDKLRTTVGMEQFGSVNKYHKHRERWVAAMVLLGIKEIWGEGWWLRSIEDTAPDVAAITIRPDPSAPIKPFGEIKVEIIQIPEIARVKDWPRASSYEEELAEFIRLRKFGMLYGKETSLFVYLRQEQKGFRVAELAKCLILKSPPFQEIWLLGCIDPSRGEFLVSRLIPDLQVKRISLVQVLGLEGS